MGSYSEGIKQVFKETRSMLKKEPKFKVGDRVICRLTKANVSDILDEEGVVSRVYQSDFITGDFPYEVTFGNSRQTCYEHADAMEAVNPQDSVNNPTHYNQAGIECIEAIKAMASTMKGPGAYMAGNILKYLWRHEYKNGLEDLHKARWYLNALIELHEND